MTNLESGKVVYPRSGRLVDAVEDWILVSAGKITLLDLQIIPTEFIALLAGWLRYQVNACVQQLSN